MAKNQRDFFKKKNEWSEIKDTLLRCYLPQYFQKLLVSGKPIFYIDCFAGKGKFDDGNDGSPLIAMQIINERLGMSRISRKNNAIVPCFIELNHAADLEQNLMLHPYQYGTPQVVDGKFEDTVVDRTLNEWSDWQLKNLNAIVWLYRGEPEKYRKLLKEYYAEISALLAELDDICRDIPVYTDDIYADMIQHVQAFSAKVTSIKVLSDCFDAKEYLNRIYDSWRRTTEQIFDDVTLFERINQHFTAKKRGIKTLKTIKSLL